MNAPLPLKAAQGAAGAVYDSVARGSNEVAGLLARRLSEETQGEALFSPGDRGRYATDASIYQITPVGVFVPSGSEDVKLALDICRDLKVPIVARGAGTSQCGQTVGAGLVIDHSKHVRKILNFDPALLKTDRFRNVHLLIEPNRGRENRRFAPPPAELRKLDGDGVDR